MHNLPAHREGVPWAWWNNWPALRRVHNCTIARLLQRSKLAATYPKALNSISKYKGYKNKFLCYKL